MEHISENLFVKDKRPADFEHDLEMLLLSAVLLTLVQVSHKKQVNVNLTTIIQMA